MRMRTIHTTPMMSMLKMMIPDEDDMRIPRRYDTAAGQNSICSSQMVEIIGYNPYGFSGRKDEQ